ncbi:MAG: nucleotidyltransferase domain-containing protein [Clostridiales bacterium]|nr:nucleotidyltransferase domain-containing protein [Clostridiales bacterium]
MYSNNEIMQFINIVVKVADPDRIILYGSYAYGNPTEKSDLDLLVIRNGKDFTLDDEVALDIAIYKRRKKLKNKTHYDIFYATDRQVQEIARNDSSFVDALQKGKVIYARAT